MKKTLAMTAMAVLMTAGAFAAEVIKPGEGPDGFASTTEHAAQDVSVDENGDGKISGAEHDRNDNRNNSSTGSTSGGNNR